MSMMFSPKKKNYSKVDLKQRIEKILEQNITASVTILGQKCEIVSINDRIDGYVVGFITSSNNRGFALSDIQLMHTDLFEQIDDPYNGYEIIDIIHKYINMIGHPIYTSSNDYYTEEDYCIKIFGFNFFAIKTSNKNLDDFIVQFQCNSQRKTISMTLDDLKTFDIVEQIKKLLCNYNSKITTSTESVNHNEFNEDDEYFHHP